MEEKQSIIVKGDILVQGEAVGEVIATTEMFSFWGGFNQDTGIIIDHHHPLVDQSLSGKIFVVPKGKGSSTGSPILVDAIMSGNAPAALVLKNTDEIMAIGGIICEEFFNTTIPMIVLNEDQFDIALTAKKANIHHDGHIKLCL